MDERTAKRLKVFGAPFFKKARPEPGAAGGKVQGNARTALVPGGHRSALTEPAGETAQRIGRGPGAVAPCLPFPPACAKGRRTLSRAGQAGLWKSSAGRGPAQETPDEGFLRETVRWTVSLFSCVCRRRLRPQGRRPRTPTTFEKVDETFTFLHPTQARAACQPPSASPAALKRRSRHVQSGHGPAFASCPAGSPAYSSK